MIARLTEAFRPALKPLALIAVLLLCLMGAGALIQPPPVRTVNSAAQFDAKAATTRLARILGDQKPHPVDSLAQDELRTRLLTEIRGLGLEPSIGENFECKAMPWGSQAGCAQVRNIVFSIGPQHGPAILAASHYDSVPAGPGASDDGVGMAAWLEIARILSHQKLTRRIIFLISDGEEYALLGAQAFSRYPMMKDVQALVNLEARGTRGPAIFFETNRPNADSVRAYAASAARPLANSIMADVYRLLPNATDVTVLRQENLDIINIALLDGYENYHTPRDSLANLDARSLQHMGDSALGVTRKFAMQQDGGSLQSLAFTDIASRIFIALPEWLARLGVGFGAIAAAVLLWRQPAKRRGALGAPIFALALALLISASIGAALGALRPGEYWFAYPQASRVWMALSAFSGIVLSLQVLGRGATAPVMQAAAMLWFALLGLAGSFLLPGLSILFLLPSLIFGLGALASLRWKQAFKWSALLAALMSLIIWAPSIHLAELALGFEIPFALTLLTLIMLLPWIGILVRVNNAASWRPVALSVYVATIVFALVAAILPSFSSARPQPLNLTYFLDADKKEARILAGAADRPLPKELKQAADFTPRYGTSGDLLRSWSASAPFYDLPAPDLEIISDQISLDKRIVRTRLRMKGAYRVSIRIPRSARPSHAAINGVDAPLGKVVSKNSFVALACQGRACDGAEIVFYLAAGPKPLKWTILGNYLLGDSGAAPPMLKDLIAKRPANSTPIQIGDSITTIRER